MVSSYTKYSALFLVSLLPVITLLFRGVPWGADSFAFLAVACGQHQYAGMLGSPQVFVWFVENLIGCNFLALVLFQWLFYVLVLLSLWVLGKKGLGEHAWLLPVYVGTLTPLFFIQVISFENDFYGWVMAFWALALFGMGLSFQNRLKGSIVVFLGLCLAFLSVLTWQASVFVLLATILLLNIPLKFRIMALTTSLTILFYINAGYVLTTINYLPALLDPSFAVVTEELPILGIIFVLHILHFWKRIPQPFKLYGLGLTFLGLIKLKYMFLATPFLLMGLIDKEKKEGLTIRGKTFPVALFVIILGLGWIVTGITLSPTQVDLSEMRGAIHLSQDQNIPLYNDWGYGWTFTYLGFETKYKISLPDPDYNKLERPYVAYSSKALDCNQLAKKTFVCS